MATNFYITNLGLILISLLIKVFVIGYKITCVACIRVIQVWHIRKTVTRVTC